MKKLVFVAVVVLVLAIVQTQAALIFSDNFNSYSDGDLLGQGGWTITGTSVVNPIQVSGGVVSLQNTGQDAYDAFSSPVDTTAVGSFFIGLDLDVTAANATGDYFLHTTTTAGGTSGFYDKLEARSSGTGTFQLGMEEAGSDTVVWGGDLNLGTIYRVVTEQDFVSGALNDTFELYVDPTDTSVAGNNTSYLNFTWNGTTAEASTYAEINFRQGTAANAPTETIDNLAVGTVFSDVAAAPEPSTLAFGLVGALVGLAAWRRKH